MPGPQEYSHLGSHENKRKDEHENVGGYSMPKSKGGEGSGYSLEPDSYYGTSDETEETAGRNAA